MQQQNIAQNSVISKSVSQADRGNLDAIKGQSQALDKIFPIFDEIFKITSVSDIVTYIVTIYQFLQLLAISIFPPALYLYNFSDAMIIAIKVALIDCSGFDKIVGSNGELEFEGVISFIVFAILIFFSVAFFAITAVYQHFTKRVNKYVLFALRYIIEFIPRILAIPLANYFGLMFILIARNAQPVVIVCFVFSAIFYVFDLIVLYLIESIISISPYLSSSPMASLHSKIQFLLTGIFSVFHFAMYVFQLYSRWLDMIVIVLHLIYVAFLSIYMFSLPFTFILANAVMNSLLFACFILDILSIISWAIDPINDIPIICCAFGGIIIGLIVYIPIFQKLYLKFKNKLNINFDSFENEGNTNPDLIVQSVLDQLHIHKLPIIGKFFLHIGLLSCSNLFIDTSLIKYVIEFHESNSDLLVFIIQILVLFPSSVRLLKFYFTKLLEMPARNFQQRFLIYEAHQIVSKRESSASVEINETILKMRHLSVKGMNGAKNFWSDVPTNPDSLYQTRLFTDNAIAQFEESVKKWPNNVRLREEYQKFLIEVATDFNYGVKMKHQSELIEQGKNFVIDYSYRSLIHIVPEYLKRGIFDVKGNRVVKKVNNNESKGSQNSSRNGSTVSSGTIDGELDIEIEENISKQLFPQSRLRLAFQRSFENRKSPYSSILKMTTIMSSIFLIAILLFLYIFYYDRFDVMIRSMDRHFMYSQIRFGIDAAVTMISYNWLLGAGIYEDDIKEQIKLPSEVSNNYNLNFGNDPFLEIIKWEDYSYANLNNFLSNVLSLSEEVDNIRDIVAELTEKTTRYNFCYNGSLTQQSVNQTLKASLFFLLAKIRQITEVTSDGTPVFDPAAYAQNDDICGLFANMLTVSNAFDQMEVSMRNYVNNVNNAIHDEMMIIFIVCIIGYCVLTIPALSLLLGKYYYELKHLLSLMSGLDHTVKNQASSPFKAENSQYDESTTEKLSTDKIRVCLLTLIIDGSQVFAMILMVILMVLIMGENENYTNLNEWQHQSIMRSYYTYEAMLFGTFSLVADRPEFENNFITRPLANQRGLIALQSLETANSVLINGGNNVLSCTGYNDEIDKIHFESRCFAEPDGTFHDTYRCASLESAISIFISVVQEILKQPNQTLSANSSYYQMVHLANDHIVDPTFHISSLFTESGRNSHSKFRTNLLIILIVGIIYSIIAIPFIFFNISKLDKAYKGGLQMLRRIPPLAFSANKNLMNFLLNKKEKKNEGKMTAAKSMIHMSNDSVFVLNKNESIEAINNAVTELFGYTPDQLLGQSINCILPEENSSEIFQQFALMKNGQCTSLIFETDSIGVSDDDSQIPIHVTILGISDHGSNTAKNFAVVIRDQTELVKHKKEVEEAKEKSEKLLYQILPRDIVVRLNQGETDISFSVPSATIIFIDIVKWSDYSSTLTPSQIMENLTVIFSRFDSLLQKYPLITKIKLIGDIFMAAAGLFTPDEPPQNHAAQMISFGLDSLIMLEEANTVLESNLQSRIGVNTDGPLIAGILGTDKPAFDIIGDPINVASRLQSTCIPNTVQISQMTYDLVSDLNFIIEYRGEIELKGKGKKKTYLVSSTNSNSFFLQDPT